VPPTHLPSALRPVATWLLALGLGAFAVAQPILPPREVKYPPALSPAAALAALTVADGLQVELVAAEPDVLDPIDVAWGADGRMWVVEMGDYPLGADGNGRPGGRVRVLESTRGDGRYDRSTLFADGLPFPTSAVPWRDGVLVTAAPTSFFSRTPTATAAPTAAPSSTPASASATSSTSPTASNGAPTAGSTSPTAAPAVVSSRSAPGSRSRWGATCASTPTPAAPSR
jgi:hypothetical protein